VGVGRDINVKCSLVQPFRDVGRFPTLAAASSKTIGIPVSGLIFLEADDQSWDAGK
jgi:hypothetical protein